MKHIAEIITDHIDEDNFQYVDAYFDDDADSEGKTIAMVCLDTKKVVFIHNEYRLVSKVKNAIKEILDSIVIEKPKVVVKIDGGIVTDVFSDTELDLDVIDFDTEGISEDEEVVKIPDYCGVMKDAYQYCSGILEVNTDEAKAVFKAIN